MGAPPPPPPAAVTAEGGPSISVNLRAPVVVLPVRSTSHEHIVARLGHVDVSNRFSVSEDGLLRLANYDVAVASVRFLSSDGRDLTPNAAAATFDLHVEYVTVSLLLRLRLLLLLVRPRTTALATTAPAGTTTRRPLLLPTTTN